MDHDPVAPDEGVRRSNPERPTRIGRPGRVGHGSDGGSAGARRRTTAGSPEFANPAFQGLVQGAVWPWVEYAMRVTQLGTHGVGLGPGWSSLRRGAALGGDARRSAACKPFCGSGACAKRVWGLHKTRERLCRGRAGQRGAMGHPPWRGRACAAAKTTVCDARVPSVRQGPI